MTAPRPLAIARNEVNHIVVPAQDVIVLVGGTVDPTNLWADENAQHDAQSRSLTNTHSRGYSEHADRVRDPAYWTRDPSQLGDATDINWYWQDNPQLRAALGRLIARHPHAQLFTLHGWSGDNNPENRRIAGSYLCDRLCGASGERAFYSGWRNRAVHFHLIGHSHGGNVINEFTRRAASSDAWPGGWKIRSITYLSTPFFRRLHQIDLGAFHRDCHVINVFNKYDLTQRLVADFNLYQLNGALKLVDAKLIVDKLGDLRFDPEWFGAIRQVSVVDQDPSWFGFDPTLLMEPTAARSLYQGAVTLLEQLDDLFAAVIDMVSHFERGIVFPLAEQFATRVCRGRTVMSRQLADRFRTELQSIRNSLAPTRTAFRARLSRGVFPITGLIDDVRVNAFLAPLVRFISVNADTLEGPLLRLIYDLAREQIVAFDDTRTSPAQQLAGTAYAGKLIEIEVSQYDRYQREPAARAYAAHYDPFIHRLERLEASYYASPGYQSLMDIVFTLIAQHQRVLDLLVTWEGQASQLLDVIPWAERLEHWLDRPDAREFVAIVNLLLRSLLAWMDIFRARAARLEVPTSAVQPDPGQPPLGELNYLMRVSHSVSRSDLYPEVDRALDAQLLPPVLRRAR
jgi:hypothetical protein